jgi:hypothetical protein
MTSKDNFQEHKVIKPVSDGFLVKIKQNPFPLLVTDEQTFGKFLGKYGSVKGNSHHPCSIPHCWPERIVFKVTKNGNNSAAD